MLSSLEVALLLCARLKQIMSLQLLTDAVLPKKGEKLVHKSKTSKLVISVKCIHRKVFFKLLPTAWGTSLLQSDSDMDWKWYITTMFAVCIKSPPSGIFHSEPLLSWINRHITVSPECSPHCWLATGTRSVFKGKNKFICWLFFTFNGLYLGKILTI